MLENLKEYLQITWADEDADLLKLIERGEKYLSRMTGTSLTFTTEDMPKQLLLDYCRYSRNNALEFFQENFASDILLLQLQEGIKEMKTT
ncbi:hypothetical protein [Janthinobacterium sp.]|uniref:hypothetical protein n=1 Tax=Janthinobacterium sp. TaxID=1871054 RepID=UPI002615220D|nr:hypothetical protein [Janthinobacterium sp.]